MYVCSTFHSAQASLWGRSQLAGSFLTLLRFLFPNLKNLLYVFVPAEQGVCPRTGAADSFLLQGQLQQQQDKDEQQQKQQLKKGGSSL